MPDPPFQHDLAEQRRIVLPPGLPAERREKLVAAVVAAVSRQAELARDCPHILAVEPAVRDAGDVLVITHERAAGLFTADLLAGPRPDLTALSWACWSGLSALAAAETAAEAGRRPHATVCAEAFYQDEYGSLKLGDFGLVSAFEAAGSGEAKAYGFAGGADARRLLRCAPVAGASGEWRLTPESETHACGWLATSRALELLDPRAACNAAADQFALGALLFLWATGRHPYYDDLGDPTVSSCFLDEPYALVDERPDFTSDAAAAWRALIEQMLASQRAARFSSLSAALAAWQPYVPAGWPAALEACRAARHTLRQGEVQGFLQAMAPLAVHHDLPSAWRKRLDLLVEHVEAQRDRIAQRVVLTVRLQEAHSALDRSDPATARALVAEVQAAAPDDDALAAECRELLAECEKLEKLFESAVNRLGTAYLEQAAAALERRDFEEVTQALNAILQDPRASAEWREQAVRLQEEAHEIQSAIREQLQQLQEAHRALAATDGARARALVRDLLALPRLEPAVRDEAGRLQERIYALLAREAELREALAQAATLWEAGDAAGLEALLARLPTEGVGAALLAEIQPWRDELAHWRGLQDALREAGAALAADQYEKCLAVLEGLPATGPVGAGLPRAISMEAEQLRLDCVAALEAARQRALDEAAERVAVAEAQVKVGDWAPAQSALRLFSGAAELPEMLVERVRSLLANCAEQERASRALDRVAELLATEDPSAEAALAALPERAFPERLEQRRTELRAGVSALLTRLQAAAEARAAEEARSRAEEARRRAEEERRRLEEEQRRAAAERARIEKLRAASLAVLEKAQAALADGDLAAARQAADSWKDAPELDDTLRARHQSVRQALDALAAQAAQLEQLEQAAKAPTDPDLPEQLARFAGQTPLPAALAVRAERAAKQARDVIRSRRREFDAELKELETALRERGRKARDLPRRLRQVKALPLLTPEQARQTDALLSQYQQLPRPRPPAAVVASVAGVLLLMGGGAVFFLMRPSEPAVRPQPQPIPQPDPRPVPLPTPQPDPQPVPQPVPQPEPPPAPAPEPVPVPQPEPAPAPVPEPQPAPAPEPAPPEPAPPTIVELLALHPPRQAEWAWGDLLRESLPALSALLEALPDVLAPDPVSVPAGVFADLPDRWTVDEALGRARQDASAPLWGRNIALNAEIQWRDAGQDWDWTISLTPDGRVELARLLAERLSRAVAERAAAGELAAAHALIEQAVPPFEALAQEAPYSAVRLALPALPPRWTARAGYEAAGGPDPRTGYPLRLRDSAGRGLVLVALSPRSAEWSHLAGLLEPGDGWRVFYLDDQSIASLAEGRQPAEGSATESAPLPNAVDSPEDARRLAESVGRELPTVEEWRLAAMTLGRDLLSDGFIWCQDGSDRVWAAGGALLSLGGQQRLFPPIPEPVSPPGLAEWLRSPLTLQPRTHGDGLVRVRTVFRIWPE